MSEIDFTCPRSQRVSGRIAADLLRGVRYSAIGGSEVAMPNTVGLKAPRFGARARSSAVPAPRVRGQPRVTCQ